MSVLEYSATFAAHKRSSLNNVHHCNVCPYFSTSFFLMINHIRLHRSSLHRFNCESSGIETYYCRDCEFQTNLTLLIKLHIHKHNRERQQDPPNKEYKTRKYSCEKCQFKTDFSLKWFQHFKTCLKNKNIPSCAKNSEYNASTKHKCHQCGQLALHLSSYMVPKHLNVNKTTWNLCPKCSAQADAESQIRVEKGTWYKCKKCSFKTRRQADLIDHVCGRYLDQDIKWLTCENCPFKTIWVDRLKKHSNIQHFDDKDAQKGKLKQTIIIQQINKGFSCLRCPYKAKCKGELQSHINALHVNRKRSIPNHNKLQLKELINTRMKNILSGETPR